MSDTVVSNNGSSDAGGGVLIQPTGSGSAKASLVRVNAVNNFLGIRADGTGGLGTIFLSIWNSAATGNLSAGMAAITPGGARS